MNRRDFFKKVAATVGVAVLGRAAIGTADNLTLDSGSFTIEISNTLPSSTGIYDMGVYDLGTKYRNIYADELRVYELISSDTHILAG